MDDSSLLEPLAPGAPCGPDLEYDPAFLALERGFDAAYVDRLVGPEADALTPDWKQIADQAVALLARSRDLRVAVTLTKAWLHMRGLAGLARGLSLVQGLLCRHWDSVHPQSIALGDTDAIMRASALRSLCDIRSVLPALRGASLAKAPGLGELCLRDLEKVGSTAQSSAGSAEVTHMEAVFAGCPLAELERSVEVIEVSRAAIRVIESVFTESGAAPLRLNELAAPLDLMLSFLSPRLHARRPATVVSAPAEPPELDGGHAVFGDEAHCPDNVATHGGTQRIAAGEQAMPPGSRDLRSGTDVARELDRLCAYYDRYEPSSPVPLLLRRAQRLTRMKFLDIVREIAPGGAAEVEQLRGPETPIGSEQS